MKKIGAAILALAIAGAAGKSGLDFYNGAIYIAKTDGYAAAKAKYTAKAPAVSERIARAICSGLFAADASASFNASMGVTQAYLDEFTAAAGREGRVCVEEQYLGSVPNADGSSDDIYRVTTNKKSVWYVISVTDGLVTGIQ